MLVILISHQRFIDKGSKVKYLRYLFGSKQYNVICPDHNNDYNSSNDKHYFHYSSHQSPKHFYR